MKRVTSLFLLVMGFLPFFSIAAEPPWIPPVPGEEVYYGVESSCFKPTTGGEGATPEATFANWLSNIGCEGYKYVLPDGKYYIHHTYVLESVDMFPTSARLNYSYLRDKYSASDSVLSSNFQFFGDFTPALTTTMVCDDPDYQDGRDTDNDGEIEECWGTVCPNPDIFWSTPNGVVSSTGKVCIDNPFDGAPNCEYEAITNDDGSRSNYTFTPTGQGCECSPNELIPCAGLDEGEVTNYPQGQGGCVQVGEAIMCEANQEDKCQNGVCQEGCGFINDQFLCIESTVEPTDATQCVEGDQRHNCQGVNPGDCPIGVLNCTNPDAPETPPAPCVEGDTRPECAGVATGDTPEAGEGGATSDDISAIGSKIDQTNKNLKDIKSDTEKMADELSREHSPEDLDPDNNQDWADTKALVVQFTSEGDVNSAESGFVNDFSSQEGFFNQQIAGLVPTGGSCSNMTISFTHGSGTIDACQYLVHAKLVIEWALVLAFLMYIRQTFNRLKPN